MSNKIIRHGDVILKLVDPKEVEAMEKTAIKHNGNFIVAEGETTGHNHTLHVADPRIMQLFRAKNDNRLIVNLAGPATITHPEHKQLDIPQGTYMEDREQEYDWFTKTTQQVID